MAAVSTSPAVAALTSGGSIMAAEAQRLMALSVNKIVASRSRRCGISLHRNLLVAGVLFRARDALLAAGKMNASLSASQTSPSPSVPEMQRDQADESSDDDDAGRSTSSPSASASSAEAAVPHQSQQPATHSESAADPNRNEPSSTSGAADDDCTMDVDVVGKENVPPPTPAAVQPTATAEFSKPAADAEECNAIDNGLEQHVVAAARKRRSSESRTAYCPIVSKSAKTTTGSSSNLAPCAVDSRTRSSSVPACSSRASPKRVVDSSKSSPTGARTTVVNPVVYLNRVDVTFCSTPTIGGGFMGSVRPVLVVQVV